MRSLYFFAHKYVLSLQAAHVRWQLHFQISETETKQILQQLRTLKQKTDNSTTSLFPVRRYVLFEWRKSFVRLLCWPWTQVSFTPERTSCRYQTHPAGNSLRLQNKPVKCVYSFTSNKAVYHAEEFLDRLCPQKTLTVWESSLDASISSPRS